MAKKMIVGNWKMHKNNDESVELAEAICEGVVKHKDVDVVLCPSFIAAASVKYIADSNNNDVKVGVQDVFYEDEGAYTGEISVSMLKDVASYVIIGHSERRQYFGETDESVNKKIKKCLEHELIPIVCVGERLEDKEAGKSKEIVGKELDSGLKDVDVSKIIVAYEPIWAIGTGKSASVEDIKDMHKFIKDKVKARVLYGGSVKPENAKEILGLEEVDGALVGGAALKAESFVKLVEIADSV